MAADAADDLFAYSRITPEHVLRVLVHHVGADDAVPMARLAALVTGRERVSDQRIVRRVVEALRKQGHRICAHPAYGYYLAGTDDDLNVTCEFLYTRAMTSLVQVAAMKRVALPDLRGQLNLPAVNDEDATDGH